MYDATDSSAPSVSVVMPVHNAARFLATTLASVTAQTYTDWELVAVDDGSTDASAQILADLAVNDRRIRVLSSSANHGAAVARNRAMDAARGRFVAFLDADDLWHPEKLALHLGWLKVYPAALSFTAYLRENLGARPDGSARFDPIGVPDTVNRRQLLATNVIGCSTVILDRQTLGEMRMPDLRLRQDFAFWLTILQKMGLQDAGPARGLPLALTTYRQHGAQVSVNKQQAARATWAMYRGYLGLSRFAAGWCFVRYALRGALRHHAPSLARILGYLRPAILPESPATVLFRPPLHGQFILTIAIATTATRLAQIDLAELPAQAGVVYEIFVQEAERQPNPNRADLRLIAVKGRGAARNRNAALNSVTTPLLLFADDDLTFDPAGYVALIARFAANPAADFLCARLNDETGQPRKRYSSDATPARWSNCGKLGTPELALRPAAFRAKNLCFDESFGAGMPDHLGDEYIFVCDAMRAGLRGQHVAITLGHHPRGSSGTQTSAKIIAIRKRVLIRALGRKSRPARWGFALTHWRDFPSLVSLLRFL